MGFYVVAVGCMMVSLTTVGSVHGFPLPKVGRLAVLCGTLVAVPLLGAILLAAFLRVVSGRPPMGRWLQFSLTISCLAFGGFVLAASAVGLLRELAMRAG